jgi:folate-binding Fe-S cluster repair protein YgfZ
VHQSKGCYIGQELLTRMRTRGRTGKKLVVVSNDQEINGKITTKGPSKSLAIVRT